MMKGRPKRRLSLLTNLATFSDVMPVLVTGIKPLRVRAAKELFYSMSCKSGSP